MINFRVLIFVILLSWAFIATGERPDDKLVRVELYSPEDVSTLFQLGLDVWEIRDNRAIALVNEDDLRALERAKFSFAALYDNRAELYKAYGVDEQRLLAEDAGLFHAYQELTQELQQFAADYPDICDLFSIGQSIEGRELWMVKISDNVALDEAEAEVLFIANQHAREWISEEVGWGLIKYLLENYTTDTLVTNLVDQNEIFVMPLANPDGKEYTHTTDRMWRKNRRDNGDGTFGIDLNRNFPYMFSYSTNTGSSTYGGPYPLSEPENSQLADFISSHSLMVVMNYHAYGQKVMYPWAYTYNPPPHQLFLGELAGAMRDSINSAGLETYISGQWSVVLGYLGAGVTDDWLYAEKGIPCFCIELRPSGSPGFLIDESEIEPTIQENVLGAITLIEWSQQQYEDTTPPQISQVEITSLSAREATIRWQTDDVADAQVAYGITTSLDQASDLNVKKGYHHSITISGLNRDTLYYYRCKSKNMAGLTGYSSLFPFRTHSIDDIIIDNLDPEFISTGTWTLSTNVAGYYADNYAWASTTQGTHSAAWIPDIPAAGNYTVSVWYTAASDRADNAPFTVYYSSGEQTFRINQKQTGGQWVELGTFYFSPGESGRVVLTNDANPSVVIADAVKFAYAAEPQTKAAYWTLYH